MARPEVLDVGPRGLRRPSTWVLVVVLVAIVVGGLAVYADHRSRVSESHALDACRRELHDAAVSSDLQMMAVATTTHGPLASTGAGADQGLAGLMSRSARRLLPEVVGADQVCRDVSIRPWHFSLKARRDATTAYSGALATKLGEIARDGRTSYVEDRTLRTLRQHADLVEFGGHS